MCPSIIESLKWGQPLQHSGIPHNSLSRGPVFESRWLLGFFLEMMWKNDFWDISCFLSFTTSVIITLKMAICQKEQNKSSKRLGISKFLSINAVNWESPFSNLYKIKIDVGVVLQVWRPPGGASHLTASIVLACFGIQIGTLHDLENLIKIDIFQYPTLCYHLFQCDIINWSNSHSNFYYS